MAICTLVLGESGTGKTASLQHITDAALIQCTKKPLPFKGNPIKTFVATDAGRIIKGVNGAISKGFKKIVIDDFQYLMSHEFMNRAQEVGFNKFTEIAQHAYSVIQHCISCPDDVRIYILCHTEQSDLGKVKIKTIGKMLDEKITLEGLFTIVLRTHVENGTYNFSTQNNGNDTVKSPMGMFADANIPNDLQAVDAAIEEYYS